MSTHHGPPCGHTVLGICVGCGGTRPMHTNMDAFVLQLREDFPAVPVKWTKVVGVDYGNEPSTTIVARRCALCSVLFTADADEKFISAHSEVCEKRPLEVGDRVRWEPDGPNGIAWAEGEIANLYRGTCFESALVRVRSVSPTGWREGMAPEPYSNETASLSSLRRIPRPVDEVKAALNERDGALYYGDIRLADGKPPAIETPWMKVGGAAPDPLDVKYDGVTLRDLISLDEDANRELWAGSRQRRKATPIQRAAVSAHWSAELRLKVAASDAARKAREPSVRCEQEVDEW